MEISHQIAAQIQCKCVHFNGLMNKACDIHIPYESVKVPFARPVKLPCLKNAMHGGHCEFAKFPTEEQALKEAAIIDKGTVDSIIAMTAVKNNIDKTGAMIGTIECPICKGELQYVKASNGHTRGACKCGINWME